MYCVCLVFVSVCIRPALNVFTTCKHYYHAHKLFHILTSAQYHNIILLLVSLLLNSLYSKKNLPMPPALPAPLKVFLLNAPAVPPNMGAAPAGGGAPSPAGHPPQQQQFSQLPPAASHGQVHSGGASISPATVPAQQQQQRGSISSAFDTLEEPLAPVALSASFGAAAGGAGGGAGNLVSDVS